MACLQARKRDVDKETEMVDKAKVEEAIRMLLEAIGEDPEREGLQRTPARVARACEEIFSGTDEAAEKALEVQFTCESNDIVLEKDITFHSMCEHHILPFFGKVHIAYIPDGKVAGLSKLARTVEAFARRAQIQERMTSQIAHALEKSLKPKGVMVIVEAEHMCMSMRGIKKPGTTTMSYFCTGEFKEDKALVNRVMWMVGAK